MYFGLLLIDALLGNKPSRYTPCIMGNFGTSTAIGNTDTLLGHKFNIVISKLVLLVELYIKETIRKRFGCIYKTPHFTHGYTNMVLLLKVQSKEATSKNLGHIDILS